MDRVAEFIERLRFAVPDAEVVFKNGSCFQLFLMIRAFRPDAIAWYDSIVGHVYTEVDGRFYDIDGPRRTLPDRSYVLATEPRIFKGAFRWKYRKP